LRTAFFAVFLAALRAPPFLATFFVAFLADFFFAAFFMAMRWLLVNGLAGTAAQ
jgi:hypothetical protein